MTNGDVTCGLCPHKCKLTKGQTGFCRARANMGGKIVSLTYGKVSALALDPIEKKPLRRFHPGSMILSVGSTGCNLRCPFCQNHEIAQDCGNVETRELSPQDLVETALRLVDHGNVGLAFTYNEPLVGYEYVRDCARLAHESGLKTVLVTNGMISKKPLEALLPSIDAMNVDLKGFSQSFYDILCGDLETVKNTIADSHALCHIEVTTLVIPGENDTPEDMHRQAAWLSGLSPDIPLHLSRFFPRHRFTERAPTSPETLKKLADIARTYLRYVHLGNM